MFLGFRTQAAADYHEVVIGIEELIDDGRYAYHIRINEGCGKNPMVAEYIHREQRRPLV
jgi:hypothetical protein